MTDADLSATETLTLEVDRHASLSTLLAGYDVLAREAQIDRWAALLDVAPFPENVADDVFTSPYYEHLESALARHEAAGHLAAVALTALTERQALIETAARELLHNAQEAGAAWVARLGQPSSRPEARKRWEAHAATVALYRYRHEITGASPLSDAKTITTADQAAEHRAAQTALTQTRRVAQQSASQTEQRRRAPQRGLSRGF